MALDDFGRRCTSSTRSETRSADHAIVRAILGMARALDLRVVAEGIETEQQLTVLRQMGCDLAQGYLLGRPGVPEALV